MKLTLTALAACTLFLAQPQSANASEPTEVTVAYIDTLLDAAIEDMRLTLVETGGTRADFRRLRRLLESRAEAAQQEIQRSCNVQDRLDSAIQELTDSWQLAVIAQQDVVNFQEDMINVRMDEAIATLLETHPRRLAQPGAFDALMAEVQQHAGVVLQTVPVQDFEARLTFSVQEMQEAASEYLVTFDHWTRFNNALIDARLSSALVRLQRRLAGSGGTRADYRRISRQMIARADAARDQMPQPCE